MHYNFSFLANPTENKIVALECVFEILDIYNYTEKEFIKKSLLI